MELFCRYIIPFIQKHSDLQPLVVGWRKNYEDQLVKNNTLQKKVLEETAEAFRKIVIAVEDTTEPVKLKIADIENILNGKPGKAGKPLSLSIEKLIGRLKNYSKSYLMKVRQIYALAMLLLIQELAI